MHHHPVPWSQGSYFFSLLLCPVGTLLITIWNYPLYLLSFSFSLTSRSYLAGKVSLKSMNGKFSFSLAVIGFLLQILETETQMRARARTSCDLIFLSALVRLQSYEFSTFEPELVGLASSRNGLSVSGILAKPTSFSVWGPYGVAFLVLVTHIFWGVGTWGIVRIAGRAEGPTHQSLLRIFLVSAVKILHPTNSFSFGKTSMVGHLRRVWELSQHLSWLDWEGGGCWEGVKVVRDHWGAVQVQVFKA